MRSPIFKTILIAAAIFAFGGKALAYSGTFNYGALGVGSPYGYSVSGFPVGATTTIYFSSPIPVSKAGDPGDCPYVGGDCGTNQIVTSHGGNLYSITFGAAAKPKNIAAYICFSNSFCNGSGGGMWLDGSNNIAWSSSPPGPPPLGISMYVPDGSTTTPDFPSWLISGSNLSSTGTLYRFDVVYSQAGGFGETDDFNLANSYATNILLMVPKTRSLYSGFASTTGWYATGYLFATSTTDNLLAVMDPGAAIATTSQIYFTINAGTAAATGTYPGLGGGESSSTIPITTNCQAASSSFLFDPIGNIQSGVCNAMGFLFQMNASQQADIAGRFSDIQTVVAQKPPFGYFKSITTAFNSLQDGSSSIVLMDTSSTAAFSSLFNPLDEGLAIAMYAIFAFWILRRLKYIDL